MLVDEDGYAVAQTRKDGLQHLRPLVGMELVSFVRTRFVVPGDWYLGTFRNDGDEARLYIHNHVSNAWRLQKERLPATLRSVCLEKGRFVLDFGNFNLKIRCRNRKRFEGEVFQVAATNGLRLSYDSEDHSQVRLGE